MGFNTNKERLAWWEEMNRQYNREEIAQALKTLKPDTQTVIRLHYVEKIPLKEIVPVLNRNLTTVRHHQCMGIYKLWKCFEAKEKDKEHN